MSERLKAPLLKAPFPWFGGKSRVAPIVWERLGDVDNYVEPFAGSLAVLLGRPTAPKVETVNDLDGFIVNFWRAVKSDPDSVAKWADWPVIEADLFARHRWLVDDGQTIIDRLTHDPEFFDAKVAGWWVWGLCAWIGDGWTTKPGIRMPIMSPGRGVHAPTVGAGITPDGSLRPGVADWMRRLSERLSRVRIINGDWSRSVGPGVLHYGKRTTVAGVFLDPPYDGSEWAYNALPVFGQVREWALEHGDDPNLRICLAGYEGEHCMPPDWSVHAWSSTYASKKNKGRERLWFSPGCLEPRQPELFD